VATVLSIHHGIVPGTINHREMDDEIRATGIRVATETKRREIRYAVSNNIGLGGHNGAIVLKRYTGD
jgi:3-oxoacyl-[acyl-carrier-protein] synthase II